MANESRARWVNRALTAITSLGRQGSAGSDAENGIVARPAALRIFHATVGAGRCSAEPPGKAQQRVCSGSPVDANLRRMVMPTSIEIP